MLSCENLSSPRSYYGVGFRFFDFSSVDYQSIVLSYYWIFLRFLLIIFLIIGSWCDNCFKMLDIVSTAWVKYTNAHSCRNICTGQSAELLAIGSFSHCIQIGCCIPIIFHLYPTANIPSTIHTTVVLMICRDKGLSIVKLFIRRYY